MVRKEVSVYPVPFSTALSYGWKYIMWLLYLKLQLSRSSAAALNIWIRQIWSKTTLKKIDLVLINIREEAWTTDLHYITAAGKKFEDKHKPGEKIFIFRTNLVMDQPILQLTGCLPPLSLTIAGLPSGRIFYGGQMCDHSSEHITELCRKNICLTENSSSYRTEVEKCWLFPVLFSLSAVSCRFHRDHYRK